MKRRRRKKVGGETGSVIDIDVIERNTKGG